MTSYSHSRISTFEQCKYKYKLQYIDRVKVDVPTTIELLLGDLVHRTLEILYVNLKFQKLNSLEEILKYYNDTWEKEYTPEILIVKKEYSAENYRKMGEKYITDYYEHYKPFDRMRIIDLETQDRMSLSDGNQYHVRIDKLGYKGNTYYVCDYKTNNRMKNQEEANSDRQLAMYSIWVKNKFPDAEKVVLLWHMLAFDKEVISERSEEELEQLEKETVDRIKEIEFTTEYPTNATILCNYCVYKQICPSFKHEDELKDKTLEEFKEDDGVKLVDEYVLVSEQEKVAKDKKEEIKDKIIEFAKQKEIEVVYGTEKKASVKTSDKIVYPKTEKFIELLKEKGLYDKLVSLNSSKLKSIISDNKLDPEILERISIEYGWAIRVSKRKDELNN